MSEKTILRGKVALLSGASKGLGRHLALQLAGKGVDLVLLARGLDRLEEVAGEARKRGVSCEPIACDLSKAEQIAAACTRVNDAGGADILLNNAGLGFYKPFLEHSIEEHDTIVDVNLRGLIHMTQRLLPPMLERRSGHIVNIASDVANTPIANMAVYAASKFAVRGFTLSLAREVKDKGVKVSLINPGIIDTGFNDGEEGSKQVSRSLQPGELAALIVSVLEQPGYQMIDELTVHPRMQDY
jgi:short-subunit dehydrogenase